IGEVKRRLLDVLGNMKPSLQCDKGHCQQGRNRIVVAEELTPALTVDIDPEQTIGFVTEHGGVNSHAAILARAMGIPAVSGLAGIRDRIGCGVELLINGERGEVVIWPTDETLSTALQSERCAVGMPEPVSPVSGFKVMANVNMTPDIEQCLKMRAEGIGLYRTEFEIIAAGRFLSEDELYERYVSVRKAMADKTVVFRLFDIGSDKTLPFMEIPKEANPSLGWRGARLLLGKTELLGTQARALARASKVGPVHVLYPMIIELEQFLELKEVFMKEISNVSYGEIRHGVMFEVPSACAQAKKLFQHVDFASIGTNDLTQYFFAVDRENERVSYDYNPDRPVFWNLLTDIADAAYEAGKSLSVCGELAGDPAYVPKLMAAGIDTVSVSARRIPEVRIAAAKAGTEVRYAKDTTVKGAVV
ncbi:putative PEP-binding protein, partial [Verrucomicrobiota bacterium]